MITHDDLIRVGFNRLEATTKTYGNGHITGSIVHQRKDGKIIHSCDDGYNEAEQIFCPFFKEKEKFNSVRIKNIEELAKYVFY